MAQTGRPKAFPLAVVFALICASASYSQTPSPSPPPIQSSVVDQLTLDEALRLANTQASTFRTAAINERIAAEDVRQAQAAFLPKVSAPLSYIYTTPALGLPPGEPRVQSFIANNAIGETEALVNVTGDFDIAGRLRATLARNRALLAAAHAGTEAAHLVAAARESARVVREKKRAS